MSRVPRLVLLVLVPFAVAGAWVQPASAVPDLSAPDVRAPEFRVPDQHRAGVLPNVSVVGDFTGDGHNDVAVASFGAVGLFLFPGSRTGQLRAPVRTTLSGGAGAFDLSAADFDGDDLLDVAVSTAGGSSAVLIMRSNGDGSFTRIESVASGVSGLLASGDIDGDSDPDLAVSHGSSQGDLIEVYRNDGTGQLGPADTYAPPFFSGNDTLDLVDVNADGALDLLFLSGCPTVRLGDGAGDFGDEICSTDPEGRIGGYTVAVADFDGDGAVDIATGNASGERVSIARGNNTGRFTFARMYEHVNPQLNFLVAGDVSGDGELDLVAGSNLGLSALLEGNADATFDAPVRWITGGTWLTLGQLGGSALPELISGGGLSQNEISVSRNLGQGRFDVPRLYESGPDAASLQVGDIDGDGRGDVALISDRTVLEAYLTGPRATFGQPVVTPLVADQVYTLRLADVDADGDLDALGTTLDTGEVFVALGHGDGSFGPVALFAGGASRIGNPAVADLTEDGNLDVVVANSTTIAVLPGDGTGSFGRPIRSGRSLSVTQSTQIADMDGDGHLDVVGAIKTGSTDFGGQRIAVNLGNGEGRLELAYERNVNSNLAGIDVGDLDGDGLPEVVTTGTKGFEAGRTGLWIFHNDGGVLDQSPDRITGTQIGTVRLADMNADETLDVVVRGGLNVGILPNDGAGDLGRQSLTPLAADGSAFGLGDLTADDRLDFVVLYGGFGPSRFAPYVNTTS